MGLSSTTTQSYHFFLKRTIIIVSQNLFFLICYLNPNLLYTTKYPKKKAEGGGGETFLQKKTHRELYSDTLFSLPHGLLKKPIKHFLFSLESNPYGRLCRQRACQKKKKETSSGLHHVLVGNLDLCSVWFVFISSFSWSVLSPTVPFTEEGWSSPQNSLVSVPQSLCVIRRSTSRRRRQRWCL